MSGPHYLSVIFYAVKLNRSTKKLRDSPKQYEKKKTALARFRELVDNEFRSEERWASNFGEPLAGSLGEIDNPTHVITIGEPIDEFFSNPVLATRLRLFFRDCAYAASDGQYPFCSYIHDENRWGGDGSHLENCEGDEVKAANPPVGFPCEILPKYFVDYFVDLPK